MTPKKCLHGFRIVGVIIFTFLFIQNAYVADASAASMTLTLPAAVSFDVQPTGTLAKSSANSFSAKTDGAWGYNLNIKAKSTTDMVNGSSKIVTISKSMPESEYSAAGNNNTWGFIPSKLDGSTNSNFIPASTSNKLIDKTSAANASVVNSYNITLGAKVDGTLAQGTYSNTMVLTLAANTVNYSITYNLNSGSWSGTSPQTGTTTTNSITLDSHAPTKSNYEFQGWCTVAPTNNNSASPSCSGTIYQPNKPYQLSNSTNQITLNAIWKRINPIDFGNLGNIQNFSCSKFEIIGDNATVTDTRDSNSYTIAKLADGKCWMTQNLRLTGSKTLTSADSDVTVSFALPASNNNCFNGYDTPCTYISDDYGGYYSWFTAAAGEGTHSKTSGETDHSICPKTWRLPSKAEFDDLVSKYGGTDSTDLQKTPTNFSLGGRYLNGSLSTAGSYGGYWSSSAFDTGRAYYLALTPSIQTTTNGFNKYDGFSVRCVSRQ